MTLQLLQKSLRILAVGGQIRRYDVHIISGSHGLFLLLNLRTIELRDLVLDLLDGCRLIHRLNVHGDNLAGFHLQEILQHLVAEVGGRDLQVGHGAVQPAHLEDPARREGKAGRRNEILHRHSALYQPFPVKIKPVVVTAAHVEHGVHQVQALLAGQTLRTDAQPAEVVEKVNLHVLKPWLGLLHGISLNAEGEIFGLGQAVVALRQLTPQHGAELLTDLVEPVPFEGDADHLFEIRGIRRHIHKGQLKANRAVKEVQKAAPFLKDRRLILLLGQLIIDILKLNSFGVIVVCHAADAVREHSLKGNAVLRRQRDLGILFVTVLKLLQLPLLLSGQSLRQLQLRCLRLLSPRKD